MPTFSFLAIFINEGAVLAVYLHSGSRSDNVIRTFSSTTDTVLTTRSAKEATVSSTPVRCTCQQVRLSIERLLGAGTDLQSNGEVAIKLAYVRNGSYVLQGEADTYKALAGGVGIPRVLWFGQECDFYVLVQEALGPSLEDLFNYCNRRFSLKTILLLADQAITRIEYIHSKGFLHRDIKPDNFLMGVGKQGNILYTIDFGLAKEHSLAKEHRQYEHRFLGGTIRYASIKNHLEQGRYLLRATLPFSLLTSRTEQSWGDDLESLGYIFVYLARGSLPWQGLKASTEKEKNDLIKERKMNLSGEALCEGILPGEFATYINYTRSLGFEDKPDYAYLRRLFRRLFTAKVFKYDNIFDWTEKRFHEIHGTVNPPEPPTPTGLQKRKPRPLPSTKAPREMVSAGERRRSQRIRQRGRKR
jgi:casein kinase 1 delta/casein kinase I family protein HRR25